MVSTLKTANQSLNPKLRAVTVTTALRQRRHGAPSRDGAHSYRAHDLTVCRHEAQTGASARVPRVTVRRQCLCTPNSTKENAWAGAAGVSTLLPALHIHRYGKHARWKGRNGIVEVWSQSTAQSSAVHGSRALIKRAAHTSRRRASAASSRKRASPMSGSASHGAPCTHPTRLVVAPAASAPLPTPRYPATALPYLQLSRTGAPGTSMPARV